MTMRETIARALDPRHWAAFDQSRAPGWDPSSKACCERMIETSLAEADIAIACFSTLTDEMVERGAEGMDPELWAYATPEDWNGARERLRKYAKRCLTEAIRAAKGE